MEVVEKFLESFPVDMVEGLNMMRSSKCQFIRLLIFHFNKLIINLDPILIEIASGTATKMQQQNKVYPIITAPPLNLKVRSVS